MREILFRGKRLDNGDWVYGNFVMDATELLQREREAKDPVLLDGFIRRYDFSAQRIETHEVERETVGQYTGLKDKNGKRIFEGDVFLDDSDELVGAVIFSGGCFRLEWRGIAGAWTESGFDECGGYHKIVECESVDFWLLHEMEIAGNIHDNPELLEWGTP